jgi:hypothetical protein
VTPQQQLTALGISAEAYEGHIIIEMDRSFMTFTPGEIQRFYTFLERAYRDAKGRDRAQAADRKAWDR